MNDTSMGPVRMSSRVGIVWGILTIILGMLSIAVPMFSGLGVSTLVAVFLLAGGIAQTIFAFKSGSFGEGIFTFLFGGFGILAGLLMLANPMIGLASITAVLTFYFFIDGIFGIFTAFRLRPMEGWGWMLMSAIASIVLGVLIVKDWPSAAQWVVGTLVGVRLLFAGWSMIAMGSVGEKVADEFNR